MKPLTVSNILKLTNTNYTVMLCVLYVLISDYRNLRLHRMQLFSTTVADKPERDKGFNDFKTVLQREINDSRR